jgi:hypothetical protein
MQIATTVLWMSAVVINQGTPPPSSYETGSYSFDKTSFPVRVYLPTLKALLISFQ